MSKQATNQLSHHNDGEQRAIVHTKNSLSSWNPTSEDDLLIDVFGCPHLRLKCEVSFDREGHRRITIIEVVDIQTKK